MIRILLICGVLAFCYAFIRWFVASSPSEVKQALKRFVLIGLLSGVIVLAASGRMGWLVPLIGGLVAMMLRLLPYLFRLAPIFHRLWLQYQARTMNSQNDDLSTVETDFLRMSLDHGRGEISGQILKGKFKGRSLSELEFDDLLKLREEILDQDRDSVQLIESYIDRVHSEDWRQFRSSQDRAHQSQSRSAREGMSREEALEILGLCPESSPREIVAAHRRLMQKIHPDRGGSGYLASKINQARDVLLS